MDRRTFLMHAGRAGGFLVLGGAALAACSDDESDPGSSSGSSGTSGSGSGSGSGSSTTAAPSTTNADGVPAGSILDGTAADSGIDHVVVVMMENRSFDHWLGWLGGDEAWLEQGRSRYGGDFGVTANLEQSFTDPAGQEVATQHLLELLSGGNPWRGCGHPDPGHGWDHGRVQRDQGFLADGSRNDPFALGYYLGDDLPFSSLLARRFTVCDHSFASVLGPTYPNREYLHSGQSGGEKTNYLPLEDGGFTWETIWDRLEAAGVEHGYYYTDLPTTLLWGTRMTPWASEVDQYFQRCEDGTLPAVSFVDPGFLGGSRTDNHPHGDVRAGERFVRDAFAAFARSPHWERGLFVLTYDEWGGFFDHVAPPTFPDDRTSTDDAENFGQAGFRVPTVLASPFARPGSVDSRVYDHTSVLRFLEWRFLGAPPEGTGGDGWWLTTRDRNALNLGASLVTEATPDLDLDLDVDIAPESPACAEDAEAEGLSVDIGDPHAFELALDQGYFERVGFTPKPTLMARDWVV
ncbi:MAG TPA: alkaline phosphatase family protein [Iamia sp.]|nr:alkaline phosphatase family protein [Iamia sp.]